MKCFGISCGTIVYRSCGTFFISREAERRYEKERIRSLLAAGRRTRRPTRVTILEAAALGRTWRLTDHPCRQGTVQAHLCLPGDYRACHFPGVVRACSSPGKTATTHRGLCLGNLRQATGRGSPPTDSGIWVGGYAGHDQCHECHCQPGHPQFGQVRTKCELAVLRRYIQGLPGVQEEVRVLPDELQSWYAGTGTVPTVPRDVPTGEDRRKDQVGGDHGECLDLAGSLVRGQEPVHQRSDAGHQERDPNQGWRRRAPDGLLRDAAGTHRGGLQRGCPGYVADSSQRGVDGAPTHCLGKRVWREAQGRLPTADRAWYMDVLGTRGYDTPSTW